MAPLRADEAQKMHKICNVLRLINAKRTSARTQGTERLLRPGPGGRGGGFLKNRMYENFTSKKIFQTKVLPPTAIEV